MLPEPGMLVMATGALSLPSMNQHFPLIPLSPVWDTLNLMLFKTIFDHDEVQ